MIHHVAAPISDFAFYEITFELFQIANID